MLLTAPNTNHPSCHHRGINNCDRYCLADDEECFTKIAYVRVAPTSHGYTEYLHYQLQYMKTHYPNHTIISDIGSGLDYERAGFTYILDKVALGDIEEIVVLSEDILTRFNINFFKYILSLHNVTLIVADTKLDAVSSICQKQIKTEFMDDALLFLDHYGGINEKVVHNLDAQLELINPPEPVSVTKETLPKSQSKKGNTSSKKTESLSKKTESLSLPVPKPKPTPKPLPTPKPKPVEVEPKGRGRPPRQLKTIKEPEIVVVEPKRRGRPSKQAKNIVANNINDDTSSEESEESEVEIEIVETPRRGRPPRQPKHVIAPPKKPIVEIVQVKGRGRPPKDNDTVSEEFEVIETKRRGRPPKLPTQSIVSVKPKSYVSTKASSPSPKKLGRPKKSATVEVKRRGRPPKQRLVVAKKTLGRPVTNIRNAKPYRA